jgi:hypothetical protein
MKTIYCKKRRSGVTSSKEAERILQFCYGDKDEAKKMASILFGPNTRYFGCSQWGDSVKNEIDKLNVSFKKL